VARTPSPRSPAAAALALQPLIGNRAVRAVMRDDTNGPTFGNLPRDMPDKGDRFELRKIDGKWRQVVEANERRGLKPARASGLYDFVIQDGKIYAVRSGSGGGHTQAAHGRRVTWAGKMRITGSGQLVYWDDGSGHYRPAASTRANAVKAGLPADKFQRHPDTTSKWTQLPVYQPPTRPTGSGGPKVPPGSPRLEDLENDIRTKGGPQLPPEAKAPDPPKSGGSTPPAVTPAPATVKPPAPATPKASAPTSGTIKGERMTIDYDVGKGANKADAIKLRKIDLKDYPPDNGGRVTRFFKDRPVMGKLTGMGAKAGAGWASGKMLEYVQKHYVGAVDNAMNAFAKEFPSADALRAEYQLDDHAANYREVIDGKAASLKRSLEENLLLAFGYEDALLDALGRMETEFPEFERIREDLGKRADVLYRMAYEVESAFVWIHTHVVGAIPIVYYESFTLWSVRGIFLALAGKIGDLVSLVAWTDTERKKLADQLNKSLTEVGDDLDLFRGLRSEVLGD
jgi:hypothetical protein